MCPNWLLLLAFLLVTWPSMNYACAEEKMTNSTTNSITKPGKPSETSPSISQETSSPPTLATPGLLGDRPDKNGGNSEPAQPHRLAEHELSSQLNDTGRFDSHHTGRNADNQHPPSTIKVHSSPGTGPPVGFGGDATSSSSGNTATTGSATADQKLQPIIGRFEQMPQKSTTGDDLKSSSTSGGPLGDRLTTSATSGSSLDMSSSNLWTIADGGHVPTDSTLAAVFGAGKLADIMTTKSTNSTSGLGKTPGDIVIPADLPMVDHLSQNYSGPNLFQPPLPVDVTIPGFAATSGPENDTANAEDNKHASARRPQSSRRRSARKQIHQQQQQFPTDPQSSSPKTDNVTGSVLDETLPTTPLFGSNSGDINVGIGDLFTVPGGDADSTNRHSVPMWPQVKGHGSGDREQPLMRPSGDSQFPPNWHPMHHRPEGRWPPHPPNHAGDGPGFPLPPWMVGNDNPAGAGPFPPMADDGNGTLANSNQTAHPTPMGRDSPPFLYPGPFPGASTPYGPPQLIGQQPGHHGDHQVDNVGMFGMGPPFMGPGGNMMTLPSAGPQSIKDIPPRDTAAAGFLGNGGPGAGATAPPTTSAVASSTTTKQPAGQTTSGSTGSGKATTKLATEGPQQIARRHFLHSSATSRHGYSFAYSTVADPPLLPAASGDRSEGATFLRYPSNWLNATPCHKMS